MEQGNAETCLVVSRNGEIKDSFFLLVKWASVEHSGPNDVGARWLSMEWRNQRGGPFLLGHMEHRGMFIRRVHSDRRGDACLRFANYSR